ncbi:MAG: bacterial transcriptional activator domain-containing protein [Coriobacteriia bacterium]|nr:bacterial transcriptional activator domain-containing protein [Coriobacteriia bacterium]
MTSSISKSRDAVKLDEQVASGLLGVVTKAQLSIRRQCYHEASDILATAEHISEGRVELRITKAILEIRCQMALSNLEKAHYAWQDLEEIISRYPQMNNSEIMLLGVRLHWALGDVKTALFCSKTALSVSRNSKEHILSQATSARIQFCLEGEGSAILRELMPLWSALKIDCSFSEESRLLSRRLKLVLMLAALSQGKLHLVQELMEDVEALRSILDLELHLLAGIANIFAGESGLAIRAAQDVDLVQLKDGSGRQERATLLWWQSLIYHAVGTEREAYRKAEDFHSAISALGSGTEPCGLQPYADVLLLSCLIQRKNIKRATQIIEDYPSDNQTHIVQEPARLSRSLDAMFALCRALLLYEHEGLRKARASLVKDRGKIFNEDSILTACLMCHAHEQLFTLLCKSYGVEHLPTELTDLLDTEIFQPSYACTERQLQQSESTKLHRRFVSCNEQVEIQNKREKPLQIRLFGGLDVRVADNQLDLKGWGNSRTRSLFISVALEAGNEFAREVLIERLWPKQQDEDSAYKSYNVTWCQMRKKILDALPSKSHDETDYIYDSFQNRGGRCILKTRDVYVDVQEFNILNMKLADYLHQNNKTACLATIKQIAEVYKGDLLPGDRYLDWLDMERRHYSRMFLDAMLLGANICLDSGESESALFYLRRVDLSQADNEELCYLSMKAYAATGRREEAINTYLNCRRYLHDELGLDPSQRITDLYQDLLCEST